MTIEAEISDKLQEKWGIEELSPVVGETEGLLTQTDKPDIKNALFSFVVSIEPAEEPIEIDEPGDRKNFPIPDYFYKVTPFFSRSFLADSTESTPVGFLTGANALSRSTSNGQQLSIIWIMSRIKDSNL